ncbi:MULTISPECIES: EAL domain-containing protein [Bacillus]|uniref:EAL domain-containing protein n=1 Tax=Bacillus TaxID=1386 RepID=UPI000BB8B9A9|nr:MULTISPECIES: EAL domain-containing protein [Bacillus]
MGSHWEGHKNRDRNTFQNWLKLLLPTKSLRYYPSIYVLRNPIEQSIRKTMKQGFDIAVIAFYIPNKTQIGEQIGQEQCNINKEKIKNLVKQKVIKHIGDDHIVCLLDQYSDTLSLIVKLESSKACSVQFDNKIKEMITDLQWDMLKDHTMSKLNASYGFVFLNLKEQSVEESLRTAYQYAVEMAEKREASDYNNLLFDINAIIASKQISLLAQPIMEVSNGKIKAWEFLTRGPKNSMMESPLKLFSVAKQTNKLFALEMLILEKAFQLIKEAKCKERVFLNFTPTSLNNINLMGEVQRLLSKYPAITPNNIVIEVTEQDSIDGLVNFEQNIKELRKFGFKIAVDDTGAGYASLHTISKIMPDIIKIDRSVIKDIDSNRVKETMLQGLLLIAKETNSLVVAEGIERREEVQVLTRNKVDLAQGYFYAKPHILPSH